MKSILLSACIIACGLPQSKSDDKELPMPIDQNYVARAIECAIAEVKFAETARETTQNPEVKELAKTIEDSHNGCLKKLMTEAKKQQINVVQGLSKENKEASARLVKLEGNEFDREYVRGVIARHEKMIECCDGQIKEGKVPGITAMCKEDLTVIKKHLESARKVQSDFDK